MALCIHKFVDGFGSMGDAVTCVKCGLSKYPEALTLSSRIFSSTVKNDGSYGKLHDNGEHPFVVKFPESITFGTDWDSWTHYFDRDGNLRPRGDF